MVAVIAGAFLGGGLFIAGGPFQPTAELAAETTVTASPTTPPTTTPPTTTTAVPLTTTSTTTPVEPQPGWLTVHAVGDTNFDPDYIVQFRTEGYAYAFGGLDGLFERDDLTIANLECSASDLGEPLAKAFTFRCDPAALPIAADHGIDVMSLANNHGIDFGIEAALDSRANVEAAGMRAVGIGEDLAAATAPALVEINGWTVAVLGMGGVVPAEWWLATDDRPGMASGDDIDQMVRAVEAADAVADLVFVTIHWGWELETAPRADDRARAEAMITAGADAIFGHHPHRLGEIELIDGRPVYWTLGNFVWPRLSDAGATTAVARVTVSPDGDIFGCAIPAFITTSGRPELTGPPYCALPAG